MGKGGVSGGSGGGGGGGGGNGTGTGAAGTCFSGGSGSGGTYYPPNPTTNSTTTANAIPNGGAGTDSVLAIGPYSTGSTAAGAGNPAGYTPPAQDFGPSNGTGGVLIVFVEGNINKPPSSDTVKFFTANGCPGRQMTVGGMTSVVYPFGGGSGGGIVLVINSAAATLVDNVQAAGGIVEMHNPNDLPGGTPGAWRSGGDGAAVCATFAQL